MGQMDVNPPAAAARAPLSMLSEGPNPGSRRCTCISMKPGATTRPVASNTCAPAGDKLAPTPLMSPSSIHTSATASWPDAGYTHRPFLISSAGICVSTQNSFEHCHAHRNPVLHLVQNRRALQIRYLRRDLAATI